MDEEVHLYKGVGKMYDALPITDVCEELMSRSRFMMEPRKTMIGDLKSQEKELTDDINSLSKKVDRS